MLRVAVLLAVCFGCLLNHFLTFHLLPRFESIKVKKQLFCVHAEVFQVHIPLQGPPGEGHRSRSVSFPAHHAGGGRRSVPRGGTCGLPLSRQAREPSSFEDFRSAFSNATTTTTTDREGGDAGGEDTTQFTCGNNKRLILCKTYRQYLEHQAAATTTITPPSLSSPAISHEGAPL